ncbi:MAG TPA: class I SAM-dependent methyltransferase [Noviherbaspirillum sp.]|jgi:SAM-dependent methyltransferase|uniref:SAM-dependent methyltransferase n=1 Tax=Noviherbaspirillum sp. TaxID=1926288 RepID=UPI002F955B22
MKTKPFPQASFTVRRNTLRLCAAAAVASIAPRTWAQKAGPKLDVPYVPTPQEVVDRMLEIANVRKSDLVYDLGCGDGRMVVTAARKYGARGIGIDIDPQRIAEARANAAKAKVTDKVKFNVGNLFKTDLSDASVVTLYLLNSINRELRPQLWRQLKVGTRVVSHAFDMGDEWPPEKTETVAGSTIYYWTITEAQKRAIA